MPEASTTAVQEPLPPAPQPIQPKQETVKPVSPVITPLASAGNKQTPSLFRKKEAPTEKAEIKEVIQKKEEVFSQDELIAAWKAFATERLANGAGDAEKLVLNRELMKSEGHAVAIQLTSQLELTILEKFEQDMVQFLRKALNNDFVFLEKKITEQKESNKLYTSKDKFEFMVKQNPALQELKERLGLDFEY